VETDLQVDDYFIDPVLKKFYTVDMNIFLETYEPGKPEYKPKLMEQMKLMEDERNKRIDEHNKLMEIRASLQQKNVLTSVEAVKQHYEKLLADKTYLINELLKKLKVLTVELDEYKKQQPNK
jgi:hypothetical protein